MLVQVAATSASVPLLDGMGRTKLLVLSSSMCIFSMVSIGILHLLGQNTESVTPSFAGRVAVIFVAFFIVGYSVGLGPVTWILAAELVPLRGLGTAMGLACAFNWSCSFLVTVVFEFVRDTLKFSGLGLFYSAITLVGCVFVSVFMPETREKTLEDILLQKFQVIHDDPNVSSFSKPVTESGRASASVSDRFPRHSWN